MLRDTRSPAWEATLKTVQARTHDAVAIRVLIALRRLCRGDKAKPGP